MVIRLPVNRQCIAIDSPMHCHCCYIDAWAHTLFIFNVLAAARARITKCASAHDFLLRHGQGFLPRMANSCSMPSRALSFFAPGGALARALPGFTARPQQVDAARAVEHALLSRTGIALVEAGTGVGKTLAYLVPAFAQAAQGKTVVISTHTLALQAQLWEKDIPFVQSLWPQSGDAALVKGRGNYLCLQDYDAARADIWTAGDPAFAAIGAWSNATETGDVAELPFSTPLWAEVRVNSDTCRGRDCRFFDRCFYFRMRRAAQDARILLVNHALFFSDLAQRSRDADAGLLPDYDFVVFDEAHHIETAAAAAFGVAFSSARLPSLLEKTRRAARVLDMNIDRVQAIDALSRALFAPFGEGGRAEFVVGDILRTEGEMQGAREQAEAVGTLLDALAADLLKADTGGQPALKDRVDGLRRSCVRAKEELLLVFGKDDANFVRWGSVSKPGRGREGAVPTVTLNWTPVSVAPILKETLWQEPRTAGAALVSATLSTNGGFAFLRERLGLGKDGVTETVVGSPFDYGAHCVLYVPDSLPPPADTDDYARQAASETVALLRAAGGGAFLLFTSYRALFQAYDVLAHAGLPFPLLRQGDAPNGRLIAQFKETPNAVLLGVQSFWEGVDVPGASLRLVVIDRIPFSVPDSPLHKARVDAITAAGGDWFHDFALPQAQLRLKQGFGRLIRTDTDKGVVAILDTRLRTKTYGRKLLAFLPPARRADSRADTEDFLRSLR